MVVATDAFQSLAESAAQAFGLPNLRRVIVRHPVNTLGPEQLEGLERGALLAVADQLVDA